MTSIVTLALLAILVASPMRADEPRFTRMVRSANQRFELRLISTAAPPIKWAVVDSATGVTQYNLEGELGPQTVLLSNDGSSLVVVDDYSERVPTPDLVVLLFYSNGKLSKRYTLGELLEDPTNITESVSHFSWFFGGGRALDTSNGRLRLTTYELVRYEFELATGDQLLRERDGVLGESTIYAFGDVEPVGSQRYRMQVCRRIYGEVPASGVVEFETAQPLAVERRTPMTIIVARGRLVATKPVTLKGGCNAQK